MITRGSVSEGPLGMLRPSCAFSVAIDAVMSILQNEGSEGERNDIYTAEV